MYELFENSNNSNNSNNKKSNFGLLLYIALLFIYTLGGIFVIFLNISVNNNIYTLATWYSIGLISILIVGYFIFML